MLSSGRQCEECVTVKVEKDHTDYLSFSCKGKTLLRKKEKYSNVPIYPKYLALLTQKTTTELLFWVHTAIKHALPLQCNVTIFRVKSVN